MLPAVNSNGGTEGPAVKKTISHNESGLSELSGEIIIMIDRWKRMRINDDKSEMY
jgi:hypothetical protein